MAKQGAKISLLFLVGGIGLWLGIYCSRIHRLTIASEELKMSIVKINNQNYLCVSAGPQNHFADVQFPGYQIETNKITIGYYWQGLPPVSARGIHANWPLLYGPLG